MGDRQPYRIAKFANLVPGKNVRAALSSAAVVGLAKFAAPRVPPRRAQPRVTLPIVLSKVDRLLEGPAGSLSPYREAAALSAG